MKLLLLICLALVGCAGDDDTAPSAQQVRAYRLEVPDYFDLTVYDLPDGMRCVQSTGGGRPMFCYPRPRDGVEHE